MPSFRLELLSDETPDDVQRSRQHLLRRTHSFSYEYASRHPQGQLPLDERLMRFLIDLGHDGFWHTLKALDGSNHHGQPDSLEQRQAARAWAQRMFNPWELQELFTLCVNAALLPLFPESSSPGDRLGHSILYRELVRKEEGSLFHSALTPAFVRRLDNGRFWEELPDLSYSLNNGAAYRVVDNFLANHFEDFDLQFAMRRGFSLFRRNNHGRDDFNFRYLSNTAVENYGFLMNILYGQHRSLGLQDNLLARLVRPYVVALVNDPPSDDCEDYGGFRFPHATSEKLRAPVLVNYLQNSLLVQHAFTDALGRRHVLGAEEVGALVDHLPNKETLLSAITAKAETSV